jgi:urease accessory protein UreF
MDDAALMATYASVSGPGFAALRLLALDPAQVVSVIAELAEDIDRVAAIAIDAVKRDVDQGATESGRWSRLPALASPWLDFYAEAHAEMEVRLFAS